VSRTIEDIAHEAVVRRAHERLLLLGEMRDADRLNRSGKSQREIASILRTSQPRVGRLLRGAQHLGGDPTAEEIILLATVDGTPRSRLVKRLCSLRYTFHEAPFGPHASSASGNWGQVTAAHLCGLLDDEEYEQIRSVVAPPVGSLPASS
jgi:hypothetical protein